MSDKLIARLQSRISLRRNEIREVEAVAAKWKQMGYGYREEGLEQDADYSFEFAACIRKEQIPLVKDQKLDKHLLRELRDQKHE